MAEVAKLTTDSGRTEGGAYTKRGRVGRRGLQEPQAPQSMYSHPQAPVHPLLPPPPSPPHPTPSATDLSIQDTLPQEGLYCTGKLIMTLMQHRSWAKQLQVTHHISPAPGPHTPITLSPTPPSPKPVHYLTVSPEACWIGHQPHTLQAAPQLRPSPPFPHHVPPPPLPSPSSPVTPIAIPPLPQQQVCQPHGLATAPQLTP